MKLLLSARDQGAAGHIAVLAREFKRSVVTRVLAGEPAFTMLRQAGIPAVKVRVEAISRPNPAACADLLDEAKRHIATFDPDAILVGLSHSGEAGIDEALLACSDGCPTYAVQDFWGDVNDTLGIRAMTYFVIDDDARRLTEKKFPVRTVVIGSPKHASYRKLDIDKLRNLARASVGVPTDAMLIGYFGQPLEELKGYTRTVAIWAQEVCKLFPGAWLLYRSHPRAQGRYEPTIDLLKACGLRVVCGSKEPVEKWLAACDMVVSCFSTCCYDYLFLNRYSPYPLGTAIYLLFDKEVRLYARWGNGQDVPPPAQSGLAYCVQTRESLADTLTVAASNSARFRLWNAAQVQLPDASRSAQRILETIQTDLLERGTIHGRSLLRRIA